VKLKKLRGTAMKASVMIVLLLTACSTLPEERWKKVDEGFSFTIPVDWRKEKVKCYDSNCGTYKGKTAEFDFDEVFDLGYTVAKAQSSIDGLKQKEVDPKLLKPGEEVWHVDGRIAHFTAGNLDPEKYGKRRFSHVATLHVPYAGRPAYLFIYIIYKSEKDLVTVRRVLQSIEWKKKVPAKDEKKVK
jgi:hypothetical protein